MSQILKGFQVDPGLDASRQTLRPKQVPPDNAFNLREFVRSLAKVPNRLTYRSYCRSKHAGQPPEPRELPKHPLPRDKGPFLPLLPLPVPSLESSRQQTHEANEVDTVAFEPEEGFELPVTLTSTRQRSRSPRATKVYTRKTRSSPPRRNADPFQVLLQQSDGQQQQQWQKGGDASDDEAEPAPQDEARATVKDVGPRKRKRKPQQMLGEDGDLAAVRKRSAKKRKRPRRLPVRELALVKSLPSPEVFENDSEQTANAPNPTANDTVESEASHQPCSKNRANTTRVRKRRSMDQIKSTMRVPAPERISSKDFIFPIAPETPTKKFPEWTPGSGFAGVALDITSRKSSKVRSRRRGRRSNEASISRPNVKKTRRPLQLEFESLTLRRKHAQRNKDTSNENGPFLDNAITARKLLDLAGQSSTDGVVRGIGPLPLKTSAYRNAGSLESQRQKRDGSRPQDPEEVTNDKQAENDPSEDSAVDVRPSREQRLRTPQVDGDGDDIPIQEETFTLSAEQCSQAGAFADSVRQCQPHSERQITVQSKVHDDDGSERPVERKRSLTDSNDSTLPSKTGRHPHSSAPQHPHSTPFKHPSDPEDQTSSSSESSSASDEMLDSDWTFPLSIPPAQPPTHPFIVQESILTAEPSPQRHHSHPQPWRSLRHFTPSSQSTDPRARLEMFDSQPSSWRQSGPNYHDIFSSSPRSSRPAARTNRRLRHKIYGLG